LEVAEMVKIQASYLEVWHACGFGCRGGLIEISPIFFVRLDDLVGHERSKRQVPAAGQFRQIPIRKDVLGTSSWSDIAKQNYDFTASMCLMSPLCDWMGCSGVPRGGLGCSNPPPPKFRRYRWSPRSHKL